MTMASLLAKDAELIVHPASVVGQPLGVVFDRAQGVKLWDAAGKEYIDFTSQMVNVNLGHGRKDILDAVSEQMRKLEYSTLFWGLSHTAIISCAERLAGLVPEGMGHFHFTSGGSESVEAAFRLARLYWRLQKRNKFKIIGLYKGYHGPSFGAASATGMYRFWEGTDPMVPGFLHIPAYYCYRCAFGKEYPGCGVECANYLAYFIENEGRDSVAAFIAEPVIGAGGMIAPPPEYWPRVSEICMQNDVLLIADEVMTGFGRTGKLFGIEHWGTMPHIMTLAKGITSGYVPFGAVCLSDAVFGVLKGSPLALGHSYSGHPAGAAAAVRAMEIYVRERVPEKAARMGKYIRKRLDDEFFPLPHVGDIGGVGLLIGVEIVADKKTRVVPDLAIMAKIQMDLISRGVLTRYLANRLMVCPPLVITRADAERALDAIYDVLRGLKT